MPPNPQINIASLTFDDIKASLKTYLTREGSPFSVYTGSAFDSLLDVFAYNTLFYSFYSNMVANESFLETASIENNIVSLLKPLGVFVEGKQSSLCGITASSITGTVPVVSYSTVFSGSNTLGNFKFYSIDDVTLTTTPTKINLYESKFLVKNIPIAVDISNQKAFLGDTNIDTKTLSVFVNGTKWSKFNNTQINTGPNSNIYFVDRTSSGFYLVFGKKTINDYQSSYGKNILNSDIVTVSYMTPSGTISNEITTIISNNIVISPTKTTGGTDKPDLDLFRSFGPKLFAANDRAVTKEDYYGILLQYSDLSSLIETKNQINIWGGDELDPPIYGRVFVSYSGITLTQTSPIVVQSMEYLKSKSIVTVVPEYVRMQPIKIKFKALVQNTQNTPATIKSTLEAYFNTIKIFNNPINDTIITSVVKSLSQSTNATVAVQDPTLSLLVNGSTTTKNFYFKTELKQPEVSTVGTIVSSDPFQYTGITSVIKDVSSSDSSVVIGQLFVYNNANNQQLQNLGFVNYKTGYITLKPNILPTASSININVVPKNFNTINIKQELVPEVEVTVETPQ